LRIFFFWFFLFQSTISGHQIKLDGECVGLKPGHAVKTHVGVHRAGSVVCLHVCHVDGEGGPGRPHPRRLRVVGREGKDPREPVVVSTALGEPEALQGQRVALDVDEVGISEVHKVAVGRPEIKGDGEERLVVGHGEVEVALQVVCHEEGEVPQRPLPDGRSGDGCWRGQLHRKIVADGRLHPRGQDQGHKHSGLVDLVEEREPARHGKHQGLPLKAQKGKDPRVKTRTSLSPLLSKILSSSSVDTQAGIVRSPRGASATYLVTKLPGPSVFAQDTARELLLPSK
jgi:hypothetical protein